MQAAPGRRTSGEEMNKTVLATCCNPKFYGCLVMAGGVRLGAKQLITLLIEHPPHCSSLSCFYFLLLCTAAAFCVIA